MRTVVRSAVFATMMLSAHAFASIAQSGEITPIGTWLTEDGRAKIRMTHCGEGEDKLCGFVAWMKDPLTDKGQPRTDIKNPDPAKRNRPSLGLELMTDLKADDPTHYQGEIYNAENGKFYSVTVAVDKPEELQVHGCMLKFLCGSQTWTRVADIAIPGTPATKVVSTTATPAAKVKPTPVAGHPHDNQPAQ